MRSLLAALLAFGPAFPAAAQVSAYGARQPSVVAVVPSANVTPSLGSSAAVFAGTGGLVSPTALTLSGPLSLAPSLAVVAAPTVVRTEPSVRPMALSPVANAAAKPAAPDLGLVPTALAPTLEGLELLAASKGNHRRGFRGRDRDDGRRFFDGASAKRTFVDPGTGTGEGRGAAVDLNGVSLPTRMFSDQTQISKQLIKAIDATTQSLEIAIHGLALREVMAALVRAKQRGVKVRIVMNQTHVFPEKPRDTRTPEVQQLLDMGFDMKMLRGGDVFGVMHNKFAVFDGQVLETGSYNWTHAADAMHYENAMFFADRVRVEAYQAYWKWLWSVAQKIPKTAPPIPEKPAKDAPRPPPLPPAPEDVRGTVTFRGEELPAASFSPGNVTARLVRLIDLSQESIDVLAFSFTSEELRDALVRAKARGVRIRLVFDADQYKYLDEMAWFHDNGFDVLISHGKDGEKGVLHDKLAIFDGALVEAGSFNWTRNAERNNYENAVFLDAADDVAAYAAAFKRVRAQAWVPTDEDHVGRHDAPESFSHPDGLSP